MLILDLWGISFHAVVVFALGKKLLFKFALGHCVKYIFGTLVLYHRNGFSGPFFLLLFKGQLISKRFLGSSISSKKRTKTSRHSS